MKGPVQAAKLEWSSVDCAKTSAGGEESWKASKSLREDREGGS